MRTCKPHRTVSQRREKWPRKERRATFLLVELVRITEECETSSSMMVGEPARRMEERARTWKQRANTVQLWIHWRAGTMPATRGNVQKSPGPEWKQAELL